MKITNIGTFLSRHKQQKTTKLQHEKILQILDPVSNHKWKKKEEIKLLTPYRASTALRLGLNKQKRTGTKISEVFKFKKYILGHTK